MDSKELIITTAKEILLKSLDQKGSSAFIFPSETADHTDRLGDRFKILVSKTQEAFKSLE
jgi:hypothetical protein